MWDAYSTLRLLYDDTRQYTCASYMMKSVVRWCYCTWDILLLNFLEVPCMWNTREVDYDDVEVLVLSYLNNFLYWTFILMSKNDNTWYSCFELSHCVMRPRVCIWLLLWRYCCDTSECHKVWGWWLLWEILKVVSEGGSNVCLWDIGNNLT
jgi:hypothetical protein